MGASVVPSADATLVVGLDPGRREMRISGGEIVSLTPLESRLLDYLMLNAGHVLTAQAIIDHVWGPEGGDRDMLRQLVHRLRSKIAEATPFQYDRETADPTRLHGGPPGLEGPVRIDTIPGLGYGLVVDSD